MANKETKTIERVTVKVKNVAHSPQKLRLVADMVRGKEVTDALTKLQFLNKKGNVIVSKAIKSGVANAADKYDWEEKDLYVKAIFVDEAPTLKRGRWESRGRGSQILKRRSHLSLELAKTQGNK